MASLHCSHLLFLSWTPESTTVFDVKFSAELWQTIWEQIVLVYGETSPKRPCKLGPSVKELKEKLARFSAENVEFICEIPSLHGTPCRHLFPETELSPSFCEHEQQTLDRDFQELDPNMYFKAQQCVEEAFMLTCKRATEIFVFMVSDLDRQSSFESPHSLPVAYGLQGPSITTECAKKMLCQVLAAADAQGLDTVVFSCDGQWIKLVTRDFEDKPLTKIKHQKQFWEKVKKMQKDKLVHFFNNVRPEKSQPVEANHRETRFESLGVMGRHINLLLRSSNKDPTVCCPTEVAEESQISARVMSILPCNLADKVDSDTYNEIVVAVEGIFSNGNETVADREEERTEEVQEDDVSRPEDLGEDTIELQQMHFDIIVSALRSDDNLKNKCKAMTVSDLKHIFSSTHSLQNQLNLAEIKTIVKTVKQLFPVKAKHLRLSSPKWKLVYDLALLLRLQPPETHVSRKRSVKSLKEITLKQVKRLPKLLLSVIFAEITYPEAEKDWLHSFPFATHSNVDGKFSLSWYSFPAIRPRDRVQKSVPLLGIVDSHHILTNLRSKCCSSGIKERGISKEAWVKVAKGGRENETGLSLAHVNDLIDKQSNSFAKLTFCKEVENVMRENGDVKEADLCRLIREWYEADDEPGLTAVTRLQRRLNFRSWLLVGFNSHVFPPPTGYVSGIPIVTFEALLTNIERKIQAYGVVDIQAYNPRSLTTLDVENCFSVLGDYVPNGTKLAIRPPDIPAAMKTACEVSLLQMNPNKAFHMHTSRAPVYPKVTLLEIEAEDADDMDESSFSATGYTNDLSTIHLREHEFDKADRRGRRKQKRKSALVSGPRCPSKGARGVRQYHARDETKILPHVRLGIEIDHKNSTA